MRRSPGCREALDGRRKDARWCSDRCRLATVREREAAVSGAFWARLGTIRAAEVRARARRPIEPDSRALVDHERPRV
jgi:hypothetical protein